MSDPRKIRIGILGTANIARKNQRAMKLSETCEVVAVASRSLAKAEGNKREIADDGTAGGRGTGVHYRICMGGLQTGL
jgi:hypothetical protein